MEHQEKPGIHSENISSSKLLCTVKVLTVQSCAFQHQAANLNALPWRYLDGCGPCCFSWLNSFCVFRSSSPKARIWLSWTVSFRCRLPGTTYRGLPSLQWHFLSNQLTRSGPEGEALNLQVQGLLQPRGWNQPSQGLLWFARYWFTQSFFFFQFNIQ